jgi:hypothetical protein
MARRDHRRIARRKDGSYELRLPEHEREIVRDLVSQLRDLLLASTDDPALRRLFPAAYPGDPERDHEYQTLVRDELLDHRLRALEVVEQTLDAEQLDDEQLTAWMGALNDLRLVLGTRLDVDETLPELDPEDPLAPAYALYEYLGWLLSHVVDALSEGL